jgi:YD repeat-containing protein
VDRRLHWHGHDCHRSSGTFKYGDRDCGRVADGAGQSGWDAEHAPYLFGNSLAGGGDFPTSSTDEGGHTRQYGYDSVGQLTSASDLGGAAYSYGYTDAQMTSITDPIGQHVGYAYTPTDQLSTVTGLDGGVTRYSYGPNNLPSGITKPSGTNIVFTYDADGRVTSRTSSSGEQQRFTYTADGRVATAEDSSGVTAYTYTPLGEVASITYPGGATLRYERDLVGRVVAGNMFEKVAKGGLCGWFKDQDLADYIWFEPSVMPNGKAVTDGLNCRQTRRDFIKNVWPVRGASRPDFIITNGGPASNPDSGWLVGDFKIERPRDVSGLRRWAQAPTVPGNHQLREALRGANRSVRCTPRRYAS